MPPAGSRKYRWRGFAVLLASASFLAGGWWLATSPVFEIRHFIVYGTERLEASYVRTSLEAIYSAQRFRFKDRNFFLAPFWHTASSTEARLKSEHPEIAAVSIEAVFPKTLAVVVRERAQEVLWCRAERVVPPTPPTDATSTAPLLIPAAGTQDVTGCAWADREGVEFRPALASEGALITTVKDYRPTEFRLGSSVADPRLVAEILTVNAASQREFGFAVNAFAVLAEMPDDIVAYGPTGFRIIIPRSTALNRQLTALGRFFMQEINGDYGKIHEYVDARIENRVYYK